jgi:hypothetical protein
MVISTGALVSGAIFFTMDESLLGGIFLVLAIFGFFLALVSRN